MPALTLMLHWANRGYTPDGRKLSEVVTQPLLPQPWNPEQLKESREVNA